MWRSVGPVFLNSIYWVALWPPLQTVCTRVCSYFNSHSWMAWKAKHFVSDRIEALFVNIWSMLQQYIPCWLNRPCTVFALADEVVNNALSSTSIDSAWFIESDVVDLYFIASCSMVWSMLHHFYSPSLCFIGQSMHVRINAWSYFCPYVIAWTLVILQFLTVAEPYCSIKQI